MAKKKIKVALAYRGQVRNHTAGSIWLRRLAHDLSNMFSIDLKTFCHTSKTESLIHTLEDPDPATTNLAVMNILDDDTVFARLKNYSPTIQRIFNHPHIYKYSSKIIDYWMENTSFASFLRDNRQDHYHFANRILNANIDPSLGFLNRNTLEREFYFINQIHLGNFVSQYISAGHAIKLINAYQEESGWTPDIVISMRYDTALQMIDPAKLMHDVSRNNLVYGNGLVIANGHARVNDLAFAMNYDTANSFLGDIDNRVISLLTDWKVVTQLMQINETDIAHHFWNFLIKDKTQLITTPYFRSSLIRAGFENHYDPTVASIDDVRAYMLDWRERLNDKKALLPKKQGFGNITLEHALELLGYQRDDVFKS